MGRSAALVIQKSEWNLKKSQAIKAVQLRKLNHFLTSWHQSLQGNETTQTDAKMLNLTALQADRSVCGHTHASAILDEQLCEHSVFPELRTWQIWFTHMEISRITVGEGKNSEPRSEWRRWVLPANSWHSTLWLELILPTGTTCASKQMGNKWSLR